METPAATTDCAPRPVRRLGQLVLALVVIGYSVFLASHMGAHAGGSDSSGYLNNARLLAAGRVRTEERVIAGVTTPKDSPFVFSPLGFRSVGGGEMVPTYPIGLPLLVAGLSFVAGWSLAPGVAMVLCALAALGGVVALGREAGLPRGWAWFGALVLAASPLFTSMSVQLMSDVPAAAVAAAAVYGAWKGRGSVRWAVAGGAALGFAVLVRPSNVLLLAPVAVAAGFNWRCWLGIGLGGLAFAVAQWGYNVLAFGSALETGYGSVAGMLDGTHVPASLRAYAQWIPVLLTPLGVGVLALPLVAPRARMTWVLVTWSAAFAAFYAFYPHTHETWWYLRFLLPAFPALVIGGLLLVRGLWMRLAPAWLAPAHRSRALVVAAAVVVVAHGWYWHGHWHATASGWGEAQYPRAIEGARARMPANAVVATMQVSGALWYYTDALQFRWDQVEPALFARIAARCTAEGLPVYALLFPFEEEDALRRRMPGTWTEVAAFGQVKLWRWSP